MPITRFRNLPFRLNSWRVEAQNASSLFQHFVEMILASYNLDSSQVLLAYVKKEALCMKAAKLGLFTPPLLSLAVIKAHYTRGHQKQQGVGKQRGCSSSVDCLLITFSTAWAILTIQKIKHRAAICCLKVTYKINDPKSHHN